MKNRLIIILAISTMLVYCQSQEDKNQGDIPAGEVETLRPKSQANENLLINEIDSAKADSLNALKAKAEEAKKQNDRPKESNQGDKPKEVKEKSGESNN